MQGEAKFALCATLLMGFTVVIELVRELEAPLTFTMLKGPATGVTELEATETVPRLLAAEVL